MLGHKDEQGSPMGENPGRRQGVGSKKYKKIKTTPHKTTKKKKQTQIQKRKQNFKKGEATLQSSVVTDDRVTNSEKAEME